MSQKFQAKSFEVDKLSDESYLNEAISSYIKDGFVLIKGLAELTSQIHSVLNDVLFTTTAQRNAMSLNDEELKKVIQRFTANDTWRRTLYGQSSRIFDIYLSSENLMRLIFEILGPRVITDYNIFMHFVGIDTKVSSGYENVNLPHQDFSSGTIRQSPCGLILWKGLNDCTENTLELWPGSYNLGLCTTLNGYTDIPKEKILENLGVPVSIQANTDECVIFNNLLFHATGNFSKKKYRLSVDCRFMPPNLFTINNNPIISKNKISDWDQCIDSDLLVTSRLENHLTNGENILPSSFKKNKSVSCWYEVEYNLQNNNPQGAIDAFWRFVNEDFPHSDKKEYSNQFLYPLGLAEWR